MPTPGKSQGEESDHTIRSEACLRSPRVYRMSVLLGRIVTNVPVGTHLEYAGSCGRWAQVGFSAVGARLSQHVPTGACPQPPSAARERPCHMGAGPYSSWCRHGTRASSRKAPGRPSVSRGPPGGR